MSRLRVSLSDCSYKQLVKVAQQCNFVVIEGGKHCKIKLGSGEFVTTIPRHTQLKRETVRTIVKQFNKFGANIPV